MQIGCSVCSARQHAVPGLTDCPERQSEYGLNHYLLLGTAHETERHNTAHPRIEIRVALEVEIKKTVDCRKMIAIHAVRRLVNTAM